MQGKEGEGTKGGRKKEEGEGEEGRGGGEGGNSIFLKKR